MLPLLTFPRLESESCGSSHPRTAPIWIHQRMMDMLAKVSVDTTSRMARWIGMEMALDGEWDTMT